MTPYTPDLTPEASALLAAAQAINRKRDKIDHDHGMKTPAASSLDEHLRTVIAALAVGLNREDWASVAEAYDMLQGAEMRARKEETLDINEAPRAQPACWTCGTPIEETNIRCDKCRGADV